MHAETELTVVLLASLALVIGAIVRVLSRRFRIPFTIAMLLLGIGAGLMAIRLGDEHNIFVAVLRSGAQVSPHTIIFVFLPALIFESAYGIDVHSFRKDLGSIILLALPAVVVTTGLVAAVMFGLTRVVGWTWGWPSALVFGALISATDPVAVVAILREVKAPRRLAILIEGESLLNDGTAIVLYTVLLALLTGGASAELGVGEIVGRFGWVVTGGLGVGLILSVLVAGWIAKTFNDPIMEITLTMVLAYASMIVAEGILHVSGVMAVVVAGLWMSGPGRTRISPEVLHFLHRFWETLAYVANTLIFFLVGLVIATQVGRAPPGTILLILAVFTAMQVIRFAVTLGFRPLMGLTGEKVSTRESLVMSWGGLRGAVSLALALAICREPAVGTELGNQILVVTAGVVLLTILVNGTTTGWLLAKLGFTKEDPGDALANLSIESTVIDEVDERIEAVSQTRDLQALPWKDVRERLAARRQEMALRAEQLEVALTASGHDQKEVGYWRKALEIEHGAYWKAFAHGTLGAVATRILAHEVALHVDRLAKGDLTPPASRVPEGGGARERLAFTLRRMNVDLAGVRFQRMSLLYDLCRGQALAADRVLSELPEDSPHQGPVGQCYRGYLRSARQQLEDLRTHLPEVTAAIETRLAHRIQLNFERDAYEERAEEGALSPQAGEAALQSVEDRMKALKQGATKLPIPETADLCRDTPLFAGLDEEALAEIARITKEEVHAPGEVLCKEGATGDSMYIVARGAVEVLREIDGAQVVLDLLGGGDIVGEMSLLSGEPRQATIRAATPLTVGKVQRDDFERVLESMPGMRERIWHAFQRRLLDNHARGRPGFEHTSHDDRVGWADAGRTVVLDEGDDSVRPEAGDAWLFVVRGRVRLGDEDLNAPALVPVEADQELIAPEGASILLLPPPP